MKASSNISIKVCSTEGHRLPSSWSIVLYHRLVNRFLPNGQWGTVPAFRITAPIYFCCWGWRNKNIFPHPPLAVHFFLFSFTANGLSQSLNYFGYLAHNKGISGVSMGLIALPVIYYCLAYIGGWVMWFVWAFRKPPGLPYHCEHLFSLCLIVEAEECPLGTDSRKHDMCRRMNQWTRVLCRYMNGNPEYYPIFLGKCLCLMIFFFSANHLFLGTLFFKLCGILQLYKYSW